MELLYFCSRVCKVLSLLPPEACLVFCVLLPAFRPKRFVFENWAVLVGLLVFVSVLFVLFCGFSGAFVGFLFAGWGLRAIPWGFVGFFV